jgi:hypothetical protein
MVIRKVIVDSFGTLMSPKSPGVIGQYVSVIKSNNTTADRYWSRAGADERSRGCVQARVAAAKGVYVNQDKLRGAFGQGEAPTAGLDSF